MNLEPSAEPQPVPAIHTPNRVSSFALTLQGSEPNKDPAVIGVLCRHNGQEGQWYVGPDKEKMPAGATVLIGGAAWFWTLFGSNPVERIPAGPDGKLPPRETLSHTDRS